MENVPVALSPIQTAQGLDRFQRGARRIVSRFSSASTFDSVQLTHGFNFVNLVGQSSTGPVFGMPGAEVNLLYIAGLLSLVVSGAGRWSMDSDEPRERRVVTTEILQE
jgi:hypothetical protein